MVHHGQCRELGGGLESDSVVGRGGKCKAPAQTFKIDDGVGVGLMLMEGGVDSHHSFQFRSPLSPLQSQIQGDGVDLPVSIHDLWQQASPEDSHVSCPSLITFRGFLLPLVKSSNSLGWLAKPSGPALSCLSSIISCYTSPHSFHLHRPPPSMLQS